MIKIIYAVDGEVVPDLKVEEWANNLLIKAKDVEYAYRAKELGGTLEETDSPDVTIRVGAEIMILQMCAHLYAGTITNQDIAFYLPNYEEPLRIVMRGNGRWGVSGEPGFCETYDRILNKMVGF